MLGEKDQNEEYEERRSERILYLRKALEESTSFNAAQKQLLADYISALEEANVGINAAHNRIRLRKKELADLNSLLHKLSMSQLKLIDGIEKYHQDITTVLSKELKQQRIEIAEQNTKNQKFFKAIVIFGVILIAFMSFILFGSKEMINVLNGLSTALRFAQTII